MSKNLSPRVRRPHHVPRQLGGRWIARSLDGAAILGSGETPEEARAEALRRHPERTEVAYEWVPPADQHLIGSSLLSV